MEPPIAGGYAPRWTPEMKLPLDSTKVTRLCEFMMIGLAWHHWQAELTPPAELRASFFHPAAVGALERLFLNPQWGAQLDENIRAGTLTYRAVQDPRAPACTFWRFTIYGMVMGDVPGLPGVRADVIYGISNPPRA